MSTASHKEVVRLLPGVADHTVVEILETGASLDELEAAAMLLTNQDEGLLEAERLKSVQVSRILDILTLAQYGPADDHDR